jgi:hypothetical protein
MAADVGVDSLRFVPPPCTDSDIGLSVFVRNRGCSATTATRVALRAGGNEVGSVALPALGPGAGQMLRFQHHFGPPGCSGLEVVADPDAVPGANDDPAGDTLPVEVCVAGCTLPPHADLNYRIESCDLSATDLRPSVGDTIQFIARVTNTGLTHAVSPVAVRFSLDPSGWGSQHFVGPIAAGETVDVLSVPWMVEPVPRTLYVMVDPNNQQPETGEFDNQAAAGLPYDLSLAPMGACPPASPSTFSTCRPCVGESLAIRAVVMNQGLFEADSVRVEFREVPNGPLLGAVTASGASVLGRCEAVHARVLVTRYAPHPDSRRSAVELARPRERQQSAHRGSLGLLRGRSRPGGRIPLAAGLQRRRG